MEKPSTANLQPADVPPIAFWDLGHVDALTAVFDTWQFGADQLQIVFGDTSKDRSCPDTSSLAPPTADVNETIVGAQGQAGALLTSTALDGDDAATIAPDGGSGDVHGDVDKSDSPGLAGSGKHEGTAVELTGNGDPGAHEVLGVAIEAEGTPPDSADNGGLQTHAATLVATDPLHQGPEGVHSGSEAVAALSASGILEHGPAVVDALPHVDLGQKLESAADSIAAPHAHEQAAETSQDNTSSPQAPEAGSDHPSAGYVSSGAWFNDAAVKLVGLEHHFDPAVLLT